jgi:hypothetical protein
LLLMLKNFDEKELEVGIEVEVEGAAARAQ